MKVCAQLLIFFLCISAASAQELFPHNEPASSIPKGVLGIRVFGESFREVKTQRNMGVLRLMYGLTPKLSVMASAIGANHHGDNLPENLITHIHTGSQSIYSTQNIQAYPFRFNGFNFYAKYRFLTSDEKNEHFRMALYGEWSNVKQAHAEAQPDLLDDTRGYGGGFITTYLKNRFAASLTSGFIIPIYYEETVPLHTVPSHVGSSIPTFTELHYGRAIQYNLSFGYLLYPKEYKNYEQTNWNIYLEFIGKAYEAAKVIKDGLPIETQTYALNAGHSIEVYPGIQAIVASNLRIDFSVGFNLVNDFTPLYMIGVQRYFYFNKRKKQR